MTAPVQSAASSAMTEQEFASLAAIAAEEAGLSIPVSKKPLVQSRIARRMRELGVADCREYLSLLHTKSSEKRELVSVLTTNVSSFYRERHHFEFLVETIVPQLRAKLSEGGRVRIWSAGCSSGQEPYSIAIELTKAIPDAARSDVLILATDIDPKILQRATAGVYSLDDIQAVAPGDRDRCFSRLQDAPDSFAVSSGIRELVRFRELNLNCCWPMRGEFDAIFCRNVVIYFDETTKRKLWPRFRDMLVPGGWLMLGHSELIHPLEGTGFRHAGVTVYEKT